MTAEQRLMKEKPELYAKAKRHYPDTSPEFYKTFPEYEWAKERVMDKRWAFIAGYESAVLCGQKWMPTDKQLAELEKAQGGEQFDKGVIFDLFMTLRALTMRKED